MQWLNQERLSVYPKIIVLMYVLMLGVLFLRPGLLGWRGCPVGGDFSHYWTAASLAAQGEPAAVYDYSHFLTALKQNFHMQIPLVWLYPPVFLLMILPLGFLPYLPALAVWLSLTLAGYLVVIRRLAPHTIAIWLALAFPATLQNIIHGQNGFLSAALLGGGLWLLESNPVGSGILFGLLCYKPHLATLVPVALLAARRWRALGAMAATVLGLILASYLILGSAVWAAFFHNLSSSLGVLKSGTLHGNVALFYEKMTSIFAAVILAGGSAWVAQTVQMVVALAAVAAVAWTWSREISPPVRAVVLVLGILLFTPYQFVYDLPLLALPLACLGWTGYTEGWLPGEKVCLLISWLVPLLGPWLAQLTRIQITPLVLGAFLCLALRRAFLESPTHFFKMKSSGQRA